MIPDVVPDYADELTMVVEDAARWLNVVSDAESVRRPAEDKWSTKEIIGHLIDSASNNHQRFVRARWAEDLVFPTYDQDGWVTAQQYQEAPWRELVTLWRTFNLQIARVMAAIPRDVRLREHTRHNLDRVAWRTIPSHTPATLDYFMRDYVGHLRHHLAQIETMHPRSMRAGEVTVGSLPEKFEAVREQWSPRIVADLNGQHVKVVKFQGEFVWHQHDGEDEMFLVQRGSFRMELRDRVVALGVGDFIVIPRGVQHRPVADEEVEVVLFEPAGTLNTGNVVSERTVAEPARI
jgi:mannose-6-phosphate isomerase-like protein (cupin superfamily)